MGTAINISGQRFGRLIASHPVYRSRGQIVWHCGCDCGAMAQVKSYELRAGNTTSCGCAHREMVSDLGKSGRTHGMIHTREYKSWTQMRSRCNDGNHHAFKWYGGRGIAVCDRWDSFENFFADMGERPEKTSLDRIDVNGNYEPGNCRWADDLTQARNRRKRGA